MSNDRPKGSYSGPLSLQWCAYSMTVRAMPMNYLAADLSRIDAALWGRESEIGAAIAEAPAMVEALRWALSMAEEAILVRENGDDPEDTPDICEMHRAELERHRAILSRIDGAGDTLPDAPALTATCPHCGRDNTGHEGEPCADDCPQYWEGKGKPHPEHPTGELVTVSADHLAALVEAAGKYADDLETGLEDGTYEDRADLDAVQAALAVVQGEN